MSAASQVTSRHSRITTPLLSLFYVVLLLLHRLGVAWKRLTTWIERQRPPRQLVSPRHIALSGSLASNICKVCQLVEAACATGAEHVSLHDPWEQIDSAKLAAQLLELLPGAQVREIGDFGTRQLGHDESAIETEREAVADKGVIVTVVRPNAGRDVLVRAARQLAAETRGRTVQEVVEWLDDCAEGMLPSEPDVLVVFPPTQGIRANVLHGFPPWQFRLTQIRFADVVVSRMQASAFLKVAAEASGAPKRFGR